MSLKPAYRMGYGSWKDAGGRGMNNHFYASSSLWQKGNSFVSAENLLNKAIKEYPNKQHWVVYSLGASWHDPQAMGFIKSGNKPPEGIQVIKTTSDLLDAMEHMANAEDEAFRFSRKENPMAQVQTGKLMSKAFETGYSKGLTLGKVVRYYNDEILDNIAHKWAVYHDPYEQTFLEYHRGLRLGIEEQETRRRTRMPYATTRGKKENPMAQVQTGVTYCLYVNNEIEDSDLTLPEALELQEEILTEDPEVEVRLEPMSDDESDCEGDEEDEEEEED